MIKFARLKITIPIISIGWERTQQYIVAKDVATQPSTVITDSLLAQQ